MFNKEEPLYRRVPRGKGFKYEQTHNAINDLHCLPVGAHLIVVHGNGSSSQYRRVEPDREAALAVIAEIRNEMIETMFDKSIASSRSSRPLSAREKELTQELLKCMRQSDLVFNKASLSDVVEAAVNVLEAKMLGKELPERKPRF